MGSIGNGWEAISGFVELILLIMPQIVTGSI